MKIILTELTKMELWNDRTKSSSMRAILPRLAQRRGKSGMEALVDDVRIFHMLCTQERSLACERFATSDQSTIKG